MNIYEKYFENYTCPKCRGRSCTTSEVSLSSLPKKLIMGKNNQHFLLVTCTLCGYTEMFNMEVLANVKEKIPVKQPSPAIEKME